MEKVKLKNLLATTKMWGVPTEYVLLAVGDSDAFTEEEKSKLVIANECFCKRRKPTKYDAYLLCEALYFLLFGFRVRLDEAVKGVTGSYFYLLKELLSMPGEPSFEQVRVIRRRSTLIEHVLENSAVGRVIVTPHAWRRFFERLSPPVWWPGDLDENFRLTFVRALPVELPPDILVRRLMASSYEKAHYLFDQPTGLRFVISGGVSDSGIRRIITVERPKPGYL